MSQQLTDASAAAVQQRAAQAGLTKLLARDMQSLRKLIVPARMQQTVPQWILAVRALVGQYSKASGSLAANYYDAERAAARVTGRFTVPLPDPPPDEQVEASLRWATKDIWPRNPDDPKTTAVQKLPLEQRLDAAEVKSEAVAQKLVVDSGRGTVHNAVQRDKQAVGYARAAALGACAFCRLMATRGMVFKSAESAGRNANSQFSGNDSTVKFHDNCVPAGTLVDGPAAEVGYRRYYEGEMLVIGTAAGHELSITPNHPVLTDRGWVPAGLLSPGDHVLSSLDAQGSSLQVPDEEHVPSRIEDVWGALSVLGLVGVPVAPEDFHGDGADGEVHVVRADGLLWRHSDAWALEVLAELELSLACVRESLFTLLGSSEELAGRGLATANGIVRGLCELESLLLAELGKPVGLSVAAPAYWRLGFDEYAADHAACDLEASGESEFALTLKVGSDDFSGGEIGLLAAGADPPFAQLPAQHRGADAAFGVDLSAVLACQIERDRPVELGGGGAVGARRFDPPVPYGSVDGPGAYAELGRDLGERLAGRVQRDRIVEVRRVDFVGDVYNLQTAQGWYRADGVIVSNCHCQLIPVFKGQKFNLSPQAAEWARIYEEYAAPHSGDQLNRFRQALDAHGHTPVL